MTKKKRKANYFYNGGPVWDKNLSFGKNLGNAFNSGALNSVVGAASSMAGQGISGGLSSGVGNAMQGLGSIASAIPGPWGAIAGAGLNIVGGLVNKAFGSQINEQAVQEAKAANTQQSNMQFAASNTTDLLDQSNFGLLGNINRSDIGKDGWFSDKAKNLTAELNRQREIANQQAIANFGATADNVDTQNDLNALANYAAYGGPLTMRYTGTMSPFGNTFADGGNIHIKPENRGKFTRLKERTGKSSTWYKEHGTPEQRKMATFALNARKWKHAFGGSLLTNGAEWNNGLTIVGNGGTHEENPMEGVQMGMDAQGVPNLVEEGEVIFDDYVFSDRMNVPNSMRSSLGLSKGKDLTFAKAAKKLSKEAEERPNDPISERGLMSSMVKLQQAQELIREQEQMKKEGKKYAHGGRMGTLFDGMGEQPQSLNPYERFMSTYGQSPFTTIPSYVAAPDDNELLDVARVYNNEAPLGTGTSMVAKSARGIIDNSTIDNLYSTSKKKPNTLTNLRYAPVLGAAIGLGQNLFSKPDYSGADTILNAANQMGNYTPTSYTPIGDYIQYNPLDRNYFTNKLNAQSGAARRAIVNQSAGNRAAALAGLVASDYNAQSRLGDFVRQAEEYNQGQRERVAAFNRGTNQVNAEMGLKSAMANQEAALKAKSGRLSGMAQAIAMRDAIDARRGSAISANLTNFFNSLGDIGREEVMKAWVNENPALLYGASTRGDGVPYKGTRARGGYLTIRKGGKRG